VKRDFLIFKSTRANLADAKNRIGKCAVLNPVTRELERWTSSLERARNRLLFKAGWAAGDCTRILSRREVTRRFVKLIYALGIAIAAESEQRLSRNRRQCDSADHQYEKNGNHTFHYRSPPYSKILKQKLESISMKFPQYHNTISFVVSIITSLIVKKLINTSGNDII
jgi:hypothetical protein